MRKTVIFLLLSSTLIACRPSVDRADSQEALAEGGAPASVDRRDGDPVARGAEKATPESLPNNAAVAPSPDTPVSNEGSNEMINEAEDDSENSPPTIAIPAQYRGRWGMVQADCTSTRGDAKGLLTIGPQTLRFYESTAALQEQRPAIATSFAGVYSFTGEGQTWERVVVLTRDGNRLTRAEGDQRYTYTRCA